MLGHVLENLGSLCLCRSSTEFILTQSRLSSNHRCRSAITTSVSFLCAKIEKCGRVSYCVRRTGSRAVLLSAHQEKRCVISSSSETSSRIVLCWNPRTQSRANLCLSLPRTLNSARPVIAYSAHSVKCETCAPRILQSAKLVGQKFPLTLGSERVVDLESPRTRKSSATSCSTHRRPR